MKEFLIKLSSRKFLLTVFTLSAGSALGILNKWVGVSDQITMMQLGLFGTLGAGYNYANVKAKESKEDPQA